LPTYEYACTACGHRLEAVQKFSDEALSDCPECGGALRKVYGAVGIVLKGSGFYKNDSRVGSAKANGKGSASTDTPGESKSADSSAKSENTNTGAGANQPAKESKESKETKETKAPAAAAS